MATIRITLASVKVEEYSHFIGGKAPPFQVAKIATCFVQLSQDAGLS